MSGQWPQHPQSQGGSMYVSHPQSASQQYGYPPHIYQQTPPSMQHQQYQPAQVGTFQQQFQQQFQHQQSPLYPSKIAKPSPQTCYNCGSPEHWAMNCHEPRREVPAGDIQRQVGQKPPRRFRPNYIPPVITKYPVPPHLQMNHVPPQGHVAPAYVQPAHLQHQILHGQPTPVSAHTPRFSQQSPGTPQQAHWQVPYPQHGHQGGFQHNTTHPHQPHPGYNATENPVHWPSCPTPISSQGYQHYPPFFGRQNGGLSIQGSPFADSLSTTSSLTETPFPVARNQHDGVTRQESFKNLKSWEPSTAEHSFQMADASLDESAEDDISLLDVPDFPDISLHRGSIARLVQIPLPPYAEDLDTSAGLLPFLDTQTNQAVKSEYFSWGNLTTMLKTTAQESRRNSEETDPIFISGLDDSISISLIKLQESRGHKSVNEWECDMADKDNGTQETVEYDTICHNGNPKPEHESHNNLSGDSQRLISKQYTEERLAALGVTGVAKPIRATRRPHPPPASQSPNLISPTSSARYTKKNRSESAKRSSSTSKSPTRQALKSHKYDRRSRTPPVITRQTPPSRQDRELSKSRHYTPPFNRVEDKPESTAHRDPFDPEDKDPDELQYPNYAGYDENDARYDRYNPPPPPPPPQLPPPLRRGSSSFPPSWNGQSSPGSNQKQQSSHATMSPSKFDGHAQSASPSKLKLEKSLDRKRNRDSSDDGRENQRHRQFDDVTPKLKRRQPIVAAAYSRRW